MTNPSYDRIHQAYARVNVLETAKDRMKWDMATMMPKNSAVRMGVEIAEINTIQLEVKSNPDLPQWIADAENEDLNDWQRRNLALIKEENQKAQLEPKELVHQIERQKSTCYDVYLKAKPASDWDAFQGPLEKMVWLQCERAKIIGDELGCAPYDVNLKDYARANSMALIDPLFMQLGQELPPVIRAIKEKQARQPSPYKLILNDEAQIKAGAELMTMIGYDFGRGRIDATPHAFSAGGRDDSRITFSTAPNSIKTVLSLLHEGGHSIYTQNTDVEFADQPVGIASDLTLHESQSIIYEKMMGLSPAGLALVYHTLAKHDPAFAGNGSVDDFINHVHTIKDNTIRVLSDEPSYPLHVVMRYEIEKKLFDGSLKVGDVPEYWNDATQRLLGLTVKNHKEGCLQDVHWSKGLFGYFPTYAQGILNAAQQYAVMKKDITDLDAQISQGNFKNATHWLNVKIHQRGNFLDAPDLIAEATGTQPSAGFFIRHVKDRYLAA